MTKDYLTSVTKEFQYYKSLGEKAFEQLNSSDFSWQPNENTNSIAMIINHLSGNMVSRWTNFLTTDGEKEWRNRDAEFEKIDGSKTVSINLWNKSWNTLFNALSELNETNIDTIVYIRNQKHSTIDAINRQLAHYSYHIGQIIYLAKMIKGDQWKPLTIPKGKSTEFNKTKFSKGKHDGHFSDDII